MEDMIFYDLNMPFVIDFVRVRFLFENSFHSFLKHRKNRTFMTLNSPSYRPVSLLCVNFKIQKRLIYACVKSIIDPLLPQKQAGFRLGRSTVDQVILLTQDIENSFSAKK